MNALRGEASAGMADRPLPRFYPSHLSGARGSSGGRLELKTEDEVFIDWSKERDGRIGAGAVSAIHLQTRGAVDCQNGGKKVQNPQALVLYSDALANLNKFPVYLFRRIGALHRIRKQTAEQCGGNEGTEALMHHRAASNRESESRDHRLITRGMVQLLQYQNASEG